MADSLYKRLSDERKQLQEENLAPAHWSTASWQLFKEKYLFEAETPREQYQRIASTLARHTEDPTKWEEKFFDIMWKGWLSPATPILANVGTNRGLPVSCAGSYIEDSITGIYQAKHEVAMLTKMGFGTASYMGDIRPRGSKISVGGKSTGTLPVINGFQADMEYVAQGTARRGSWAGYINIDHGDFDEICTYLEQNPDGNNIGWNISNEFVSKLEAKDPEAIRRYGKAMKTKLVTGKGYFFFPDKANAKRPQWYVDHNLDIKASQLCSEIILHSSSEYTYTCVLASMNLMFWDDWKGTDAVQAAIVFLDCVASEFIEKAREIPGLEKAVAFTEKSRALGLGACGFHSYLQDHMMSFDSFETHHWNNKVFKHIRSEAEIATKRLAEIFGEPEWCKGYERRNSHLLAIAPTKSTALIMGGVSEGISPDTAMSFTQKTPAGEMKRINPILLNLMKKKGVYNKKNLDEIHFASGSVANVEWLTQEEKDVFKTAFEIDQFSVLRLAAARGKYLDQWQSLNLFFGAGEDPQYINDVHKEAFLNPDILALYYLYSSSSVHASRDTECASCQ